MKWRAFMEKTTDEHRFAQISKNICVHLWFIAAHRIQND